MGYPLTQNQTAQPLVFFLTQASDHITGLTGASPQVLLAKNGGAWAAPAGVISEVGYGWYQVAGNAADSGTLGPLLLHAAAAGADPVDDLFPVVAYNPQDDMDLGLGALARIGPAQLIVTAPGPDPDGNFTVLQGDSYQYADNASFDWVDATGNWPNLTGASSLTLSVYTASGVYTHAIEPIAVGVPNQRIRLELTMADTKAIPSGAFLIRATLADGNVRTLVDATCTSFPY